MFSFLVIPTGTDFTSNTINNSIGNNNNSNNNNTNNNAAHSNNVSTSSFNYPCSMSPNSQSSSSSEVHVSTSPTYQNVANSNSPPNVCPLLAPPVLAGLGPPLLPVLNNCSGAKTSLPFKLRHKAGNNNSSSNSANSLIQIRPEPQNSSRENDSDTSSDSSVPLLGSSVDSNSVFSDHRDNSGSPDSMLKTENFALKSELQRLASEVASLKNVLVLKHTAAVSGNRSNGRFQAVCPMETDSPVHYNEDLDSKDLLKNVIQFQKLNDIIV